QDSPNSAAFIQKYCLECHDQQSKSGGLDLSTLRMNLDGAETFQLWIRLHDRVRTGQMPPKSSTTWIVGEKKHRYDDVVRSTNRLRAFLYP
ncbi:MAG: c-type cytochrome domain-containing protein, partial [Pirellula sp.]